MSKLKILMVNHEYPPIGGGGGYAGFNILKQFAGRDDIELDVIVSRAEPGLVQEKFADNVTLYKVGLQKKALQLWTRGEILKWMFSAYRLHKKLLKQNSYDLVHAFFGFPAGVLAWRTVSKLPYIVSFRGSDVPGINARFTLDYKILGPLFKRIWRNSSGLVACSNGLRERALKFMPEAKIDVISNGIDLERFWPVDSKENENLRLLTVGRLSVSKRIELLIAAMKEVRGRFPNAQLTIAGGGGLEEELRQMIADVGMADCIKMTGIVEAEQMPKLYREHDIFVTATAQEGMSNAMLEAMASGLPIITTRCEGVEELIADNGIVVEQADSVAIAEEIIELAGDEKKYNAMCVAARQRAEKFSWAKVADEYVRLYENVIEQKNE